MAFHSNQDWLTGSSDCAFADEELLASLPKLAAPPRSFQDCIDVGAYDLYGSTSAEQKSGVKHSHHVLHLPGKMLVHCSIGWTYAKLDSEPEHLTMSHQSLQHRTSA